MASQHCQSHSCVPVVCTGFTQGSKKSKQQSRSMMFRVILCMSHFKKYHSPLFTPVGSTCVAHTFQKKKDFFKWTHILMFMVILCVQFYRLMQLLLSTLLKGIIRKECQSFTNHGHAKTPPTVFNPLSLWLTLPRDMGVSHTQWPPSITRATLAYLWFAQGLHSVCTGTKNQNSRAVL